MTCRQPDRLENISPTAIAIAYTSLGPEPFAFCKVLGASWDFLPDPHKSQLLPDYFLHKRPFSLYSEGTSPSTGSPVAQAGLGLLTLLPPFLDAEAIDVSLYTDA